MKLLEGERPRLRWSLGKSLTFVIGNRIEPSLCCKPNYKYEQIHLVGALARSRSFAFIIHTIRLGRWPIWSEWLPLPPSEATRRGLFCVFRNC